ncbi:MAG: NAD(P)H-binding protein, partial [Acetobacteraceae bacterium]
MAAERVHVVGASGRSGAALCRALLGAKRVVVPVVRDPGRWARTGLAASPRLADLGDPVALGAALSDATAVVSCAHARHTAAILAATPAGARFVLLG